MSYFRRAAVLLFFHALFTCLVNSDVKGERNLSRRKRYVVFPEGSSFSIALCMTVHTLTPDNIFTEGLNWGISYDLPNESKPALEPFLELRKDKPGEYRLREKNNHPIAPSGWNKENKFYSSKIYPGKVKKKYYKSDYDYLKRRYRRDLYNKLEIIMNAMSFDGRACVLRALCEASQRLMPKGNTLVEEMMRIAFTLPLSRVLSHEPEDHRTYANAHAAGYEGRDCSAMFAGCSFSLVDMALGKYSENEEQKYDRYSDRAGYSADVLPGKVPKVKSFDETSEASIGRRYNMK